MLTWLTNNPDAAVAVATLAAGWLGLTKKKANTVALRDRLLSRLRQEILKLLDEHASIQRARTALEWAADALLSETSIKRGKAIDALLEPLIEQALKEYSERLGPLVLRMRIDELFGAVTKLPAAFSAPRSPTVPVLDIEIVK